jgi:hypothetical protein
MTHTATRELDCFWLNTAGRQRADFFIFFASVPLKSAAMCPPAAALYGAVQLHSRSQASAAGTGQDILRVRSLNPHLPPISPDRLLRLLSPQALVDCRGLRGAPPAQKRARHLEGRQIDSLGFEVYDDAGHLDSGRRLACIFYLPPLKLPHTCEYPALS